MTTPPRRRLSMPGAAARALLALGLLQAPVHATIWGLKTHDPVSGPPAMLFWLDETTGNWGQVAPVSVNGLTVDADGLAQDRSGALFAWRVEGAGSTLLSLDPVSAVGTPVGPRLDGLQVRGACFTLSGRLWVFEDAASVLREIDPDTGLPLGDGHPIGGLEPGGAFYTGDLSQDLDGSLLFAMGNQVSRVDPLSGRITRLFNDPNNLGDGIPPWSVGLALSPQAPSDKALYLLDVSAADGLYRYASSSDFSRSILLENIVPSYNAGRGDLAALPAARTEITGIRVAEGLAELDAWCRVGLWVWVEHSDSVFPAVWSEVSGSLRQIADSGNGNGTFSQWSALPAPGEMGFWRLRSSLEDPR